jgi:glyoxylase-like metal-dependent hydrolase (beta-lactamase superfamily II)
MLERREVFPHVIEMNYQARRRLGCCVYLVFDGPDWMLLDIGYEETVPELIELIRQMDFPLANCKYLAISHADVDHVQGLAKAKSLLPQAKMIGHPVARDLLASNERITMYAEIPAQGISLEMPKIALDQTIDEGDVLKIGNIELEVWYTPGHTNSQLALRLGDLLFSGDNIFRDGCVGNIDAHHGSDIPDFITSLERIRDSDIKWLLPSHGPIFPKDNRLLQKTIDRLERYTHMADFGTCAVDWPLLDEWDDELERGFDPSRARNRKLPGVDL